MSLLSAPLSGAGIYRDDYQSRFHWDAVCVCGKAEAKSVEKKNERDVQTANKFTCLGKTGCHVVSGCQDVTMWFLIGPSEKCPTPFFSEHLWDLMWRFINGADETRDTRCQCWV